MFDFDAAQPVMAPRWDDDEPNNRRVQDAEEPLLDDEPESSGRKQSSTLLTVCPFILGESGPGLLFVRILFNVLKSSQKHSKNAHSNLLVLSCPKTSWSLVPHLNYCTLGDAICRLQPEFINMMMLNPTTLCFGGGTSAESAFEALTTIAQILFIDAP